MKHVAIFTLVIVVALLTVSTFGEVDLLGAISGKVYDSASGDPVEGVWVGVLGTNLGVATDSLGEFRIDNVLPGKYELVVSHSEFFCLTSRIGMEVTVRAGQTQTVSIQVIGLTQFQIDGNDYRTSERESSTGKSQLPAEKTRPGEMGLGVMNDITITTNGLKMPRHPNASEAPSVLPPSGLLRRDQGLRQRGGCYLKEEYGSLPPYDMFFKDYGSSGFIDTHRDRFSTFAIDVDDASYTLVRRYLQEGNIPPREAIRIEEFINHFNYGYNPPDGEKFRVFVETAPSPFRSDITLMKIGIKGREISTQSRLPLNLTLVIDVSGSMGHDNRMQLVKRSMRLLLSQLDRNDMVGVVAYGSRAFVVIEPTPASREREIMEAINALRPGGSTNAEAGLMIGYEMANRQFVNGHSNRIVLCSDGVANVGRTSPDQIMLQVKRYAIKGITLSSFGFGMGNYNDELLEQLSQRGNGRYAYVNDLKEARRQFVDDFAGNMQVLARDVKIQVEFDPRLIRSYRLLGYENRDVADHRFRDNQQDGGEVGAGHEVTAVYELISRGRGHSGKVATVFVRWKNDDETEISELSREVHFGKKSGRFESARPEFRLVIVAGQFAELLKGSELVESGYESLLAIAEPLLPELPGEQSRELVDLIRRARDLSTHYTDLRFDRRNDDNYSNYRK